MLKLEAPCYIHNTPSTLLLSDTRPLRPTPSCQYVFNTLIDELIWLILESLAKHQQSGQPEQSKSTYAPNDHPSHEPQSLASSSSSSRADDNGYESFGSKLTLPISPSFFKTYGIHQVLPHSLGREAILEAEIGWLEYQRRTYEDSGEDEMIIDAPSEVRMIDLFRELRIQCEILSPFAGNQQTSVRTGIPPTNDRKRPPSDDTAAGEIKGPGCDKISNLVEHSIPLLLNPMAFEVQMRAYGDLYERSSTVSDVLRYPRGPMRAGTVLDPRLMIYFVGVVQSFATYLSKGVARVVEREPGRSSVKPQDLLVFIGEDERLWDLFELTRTKRFIERAGASSIGGSYHHRTGSFGIITPDNHVNKGLGFGTFTTEKVQNSFAYLFKNHHLYVAALQVQTTPRPDPHAYARVAPRKSTDLPKRGQSSDVYRGGASHFSTGSFSSPATAPLLTGLSPRSVASGIYPHPSNRKTISRNPSNPASTTSSSSNNLGAFEFLGGEASNPPSLASHGRPSQETDVIGPTTVRRGASLSKRTGGSSTAIPIRQVVHSKKWSISSTSNRDASADSQTAVSRRTDRSTSSTSTSSHTSSPPLRKASFTNLNQKFTSMIQAQAPGGSSKRSRSRTAGSVASFGKQSMSQDFDVGTLPPASIYDEAERRDLVNMNPRNRFKAFGVDISPSVNTNSQTEETLEEPPHHNFEQFMTSGRTMKVSLTPGRFRFPADQNVTSPNTERSPSDGHASSTSPLESTSRMGRSITAPTMLEARIEPPPIRKPVPRSAGSVLRSSSGLGSDDLNEDDDSDSGQPHRKQKDLSWQQMLLSEPPWQDEPGPEGLVSSFPDSPQLGSNVSSKFMSFASFSMKKSSTTVAKRKPGGSSINLSQIGEPGVLHSSAGHSSEHSAFKIESLPKNRSVSDVQGASQHPRNPSQSTLDHDVFPDDGKTKRRGGFMSMIAKLKGKEDILAGIKPVQPQFVASGVGGINPRMKAAGASGAGFKSGSISTSSPPPLPLNPSSTFYSQLPLRPRPPQNDGHTQVIRPQKSSPMMKINREPKPEPPRSATLSPQRGGFGKPAQLSPLPATLEIRAMRTSFESSHTPSHSGSSFTNPIDRPSPGRILAQGWESNVDNSPRRRPPVPSLPPLVTTRESYESQMSSTDRESTQANVHSTSPSSVARKHIDGDEAMPQQKLLTPPPTDHERTFVAPPGGLVVVVEGAGGKQRTITSGSNSSQASNQTIKHLERSSGSNLAHPLLTPPHSPLDNPDQTDDACRTSSESTNTSSLRTPGLTSRASSSTHTSCTSELRQAYGGSEEEVIQAVYAETRMASPARRIVLSKRRENREDQSSSSSRSEASAAECMEAVEEALKAAASERAHEGFTTFRGAEPGPGEVYVGMALGGEENVEQGKKEEEVMQTSRAWAAMESLNRVIGRLNDLVDGGRILVDIDEVMEVIEAEKRAVEMELETEGDQLELARMTESVVGWLLDI